MFDVLRYTVFLLAASGRIWWNRLRRSNWRYRLSWLVLFTFLALLSFIFALAINTSVRFAVRTGTMAGLDALPGGILGSVFLFTFVTGFGIALSSLYLSGDLDLLLAAPIPIHAIFTAKLVSAVLPTYLFVALPAIPSLWAFGLGLGYNPLYFLAVFPVLLFLPLLPVSLAALAVMAVVRVVPARRLAEILGVVAAAISIGFSLWGQGASAGTFGGMQPGAISRTLRTLDVPFSPASLAGHALAALGAGEWDAALRGLGGFAALSLAGFLVALDLSASLYYSGWAKVRAGVGRQAAGGRRRAEEGQKAERGRQKAEVGAWLMGWASHPVPAIVIKDFRALPRDLSNLVQILAPLIFSAFWAWQLLRFPARLYGGGMLGALWPLVGTLAAVSITGMIFSRFALTGVSREGQAAWLVRAAPVSPWDWLWAKFLVAYLPFLAMGLALSVGLGVAQASDAAALVLGAAAVLLIGAGITGIALGLGTLAARFDWSSPHQMVGMGTGCVSGVAYSVYAGVILAVFALARLAADRLPDVSLLVWLAALSLATLLTAGAVIAPLWAAAEKLRGLE